jgi:PhnB protein
MTGRDALEPHFWAEDLAVSRRFYEEALGFVVRQHFPADQPNWFQLERGTTRLMLSGQPLHTDGNQRYLADLAERRGGGAVSLYLHVVDVEAGFARCQAAAANVVEPLWDPWWGGRQFTVADPDGHWWTIYQADAASAE